MAFNHKNNEVLCKRLCVNEWQESWMTFDTAVDGKFISVLRCRICSSLYSTVCKS